MRRSSRIVFPLITILFTACATETRDQARRGASADAGVSAENTNSASEPANVPESTTPDPGDEARPGTLAHSMAMLKRINEAESNARLSKDEVAEIAERERRLHPDLKGYAVQSLNFGPESNAWLVYYTREVEGQRPSLLVVTVNDETGEAKINPL